MMKSILLAVEQFLQNNLEHLTIPEAEVGIRMHGRPPASCGQLFYAVHPASWTAGELTTTWGAVDYVYGYQITITQRIGLIPDDRLEEAAYLVDDTGLSDRIAELICLINGGRWDFLCLLNGILPEGPCGGGQFVSPFSFRDADVEPVWKGPEWFSADPNVPDVSKYFGWAMAVRFGGGRYLANTIPTP